MASPRLLFAAESLLPGNGGICRVARLVAKALALEVAAGRIEVDGLVLSDTVRQPGAGFPVVVAGGRRWRFALQQNLAALNHSHFLYDFEGMARVHCRIRPFMTWIHGIEVWEGCAPKRVRSARRADFLLSNSAYTRDRADRVHGGFQHARVCWLATEEDDPVPARQQVDTPPTAMILARMDETRYKGHDELIECWPQVISAIPKAELHVVGRGPCMEILRQKAMQSPAAANIRFLGFVPDERMAGVWSGATVFAMPSRGEGFGLVYIEAMRQAIPVIASVHDAGQEVNIDGQTGFNVNLDRPGELADRLIHLLRNRDEAHRMGLQGQQRWQEYYRFSAFEKRFVPLLHDFLR